MLDKVLWFWRLLCLGLSVIVGLRCANSTYELWLQFWRRAHTYEGGTMLFVAACTRCARAGACFQCAEACALRRSVMVKPGHGLPRVARNDRGQHRSGGDQGLIDWHRVAVSAGRVRWTGAAWLAGYEMAVRSNSSELMRSCSWRTLQRSTRQISR